MSHVENCITSRTGDQIGAQQAILQCVLCVFPIAEREKAARYSRTLSRAKSVDSASNLLRRRARAFPLFAACFGIVLSIVLFVALRGAAKKLQRSRRSD